jgi:chorismate dehydratase
MPAVLTRDDTAVRPIRVGVVSFLNTLPLIDGLDQLADLALRHSVPSLLVDLLLADEIEVGLCSSIDYQRSPQPLVALPAGVLGGDGATLTVRLYSAAPIDQMQSVHCDTDSHTSVALMRIVLRERFGADPEPIDYDAREHVAGNRPVEWPESMLLIGDKVVTDSPPAARYPHQLDLGAEWREMTGLPFVFALWMAKADAEPARLALANAALDRQRRHNRERLGAIIHRHAAARGWPVDGAADYLTRHMSYELTPAMQAGLELFFAKAHEHALIGTPRPLRIFRLA